MEKLDHINKSMKIDNDIVGLLVGGQNNSYLIKDLTLPKVDWHLHD